MILRRVLAISAGAVGFILVFVLFDALSSLVFPTPPGFDPSDPDAVNAHLASTPPAALAIILLGATVAAFAGSYVTATVTGPGGALWGLVTGGVSLVGALTSAITNRHPMWFLAATPVGIGVASALAVWLIRRAAPPKRKSSAPPRRAA
ncbi:MAG: hypothetical protein AB1762_08260 [Gemmatimonadota bacterium]